MNDELEITIRRSELRLIGQLLSMASDEFGNHGCNDFELLDAFGGDTKAARHFAIGYHAHNFRKTRETLTIGETSGDVWEEDILKIPDFALMNYLAARFKALAEVNQ